MRCDVALLAHALLEQVEERDFDLRLSEREATALAAVGNVTVRRRRLAGRLAAKHLLLRDGSRGAVATASVAPARAAGGETRRARLLALDGERLAAFPADRYREIELARRSGDGPLLATQHGRPLAACVSISHRGDVSCAALAPAGVAMGIDLETVASRGAAFERGNFTPAERSWVDAVAAADVLPADWLYTFLWTVKEAALKSGAAGVRSVWDFAATEVEPPPRLGEQLAASVGSALGERFAAVDLVVTAAGRRTRGRVETTATPTAILSIFHAATAVTAAPGLTPSRAATS